MKSTSDHIFVICPDPTLLKFLLKRWRGMAWHHGLFPGGLCRVESKSLVLAQPADETPLAYAAVQTLAFNYGPAPCVLMAPVISLRDDIYPGDICQAHVVSRHPYPALYANKKPGEQQEQTEELSVPAPFISVDPSRLPQPAIHYIMAGFSQMPTETSELWHRMKERYNLDAIARSPFGFIEATTALKLRAACVLYTVNGFRDQAQREYARRRHNLFDAMARSIEEGFNTVADKDTPPAES